MKSDQYLFLYGFGSGLFLSSMFNLIDNSSLRLISIITLFVSLIILIICMLGYRRK